MKVLVVGASGLIGSALYKEGKKRGHEMLGTYRNFKIEGLSYLDIANAERSRELLEEFAPDVVYFPAAVVNAEWNEEFPLEAERINVEDPKRFFDDCAWAQTKLVYYSTDYVFDGESGPYCEESPVHPINRYGKQKVMVEEYLTSEYPRWLILRTAVVYGFEPQAKNFGNRAVNDLRAGKTVRAPNDQWSCPTYAPDLASISYDLVDEKAEGIIHATGSECITRFEFANKIAEEFGFPVDRIVGVPSAELKQKAKRPLKACMETQKLEWLLGHPMLSATEGIKKMHIDEAILSA